MTNKAKKVLSGCFSVCATEVSTGCVGVTEVIPMWSHGHLTVNMAVKVLASPNSSLQPAASFLFRLSECLQWLRYGMKAGLRL